MHLLVSRSIMYLYTQKKCPVYLGGVMKNKFQIIPLKTAEILIVRQQCQQQEGHSFSGLG